MPLSWDDVSSIVDATKANIEAREKFEASLFSLMGETKGLLVRLISKNENAPVEKKHKLASKPK